MAAVRPDVPACARDERWRDPRRVELRPRHVHPGNLHGLGGAPGRGPHPEGHADADHRRRQLQAGQAARIQLPRSELGSATGPAGLRGILSAARGPTPPGAVASPRLRLGRAVPPDSPGPGPRQSAPPPSSPPGPPPRPGPLLSSRAAPGRAVSSAAGRPAHLARRPPPGPSASRVRVRPGGIGAGGSCAPSPCAAWRLPGLSPRAECDTTVPSGPVPTVRRPRRRVLPVRRRAVAGPPPAGSPSPCRRPAHLVRPPCRSAPSDRRAVLVASCPCCAPVPQSCWSAGLLLFAARRCPSPSPAPRVGSAGSGQRPAGAATRPALRRTDRRSARRLMLNLIGFTDEGAGFLPVTEGGAARCRPHPLAVPGPTRPPVRPGAGWEA